MFVVIVFGQQTPLDLFPVRDLFGTMMNEGANKGILVSTSGYGGDAFNFAKDKLIELIDGGGLLYLLENHAGVRARIVMPEE
ncbi:MAG TPA: restriction endonuclease [Pyrinomonadaceae bacterium]